LYSKNSQHRDFFFPEREKNKKGEQGPSFFPRKRGREKKKEIPLTFSEGGERVYLPLLLFVKGGKGARPSSFFSFYLSGV